MALLNPQANDKDETLQQALLKGSSRLNPSYKIASAFQGKQRKDK